MHHQFRAPPRGVLPCTSFFIPSRHSVKSIYKTNITCTGIYIHIYTYIYIHKSEKVKFFLPFNKTHGPRWYVASFHAPIATFPEKGSNSPAQKKTRLTPRPVRRLRRKYRTLSPPVIELCFFAHLTETLIIMLAKISQILQA